MEPKKNLTKNIFCLFFVLHDVLGKSWYMLSVDVTEK